MRTRSRGRAADSAASTRFSLLEALLDATDIAGLVCAAVADPRDRTSLCLALPPLGLLATREVAAYKCVLFKIAMELATVAGASLDETLLRRYAADKRAYPAGCQEMQSPDGLHAFYYAGHA